MALSGMCRSLMCAAAVRPRHEIASYGIGDAVMLLEARLQAHEDVDGLRTPKVRTTSDLLEAARQRVILLEDAAVFLVGGRSDATQLAVGEHRRDQVRGVP